MNLEPKSYKYRSQTIWTGGKTGKTICDTAPDQTVLVACPREFGGPGKDWSPEDLYVASVEVCTLTTFLNIAEKSRLNLVSYKSSAVGHLVAKEGEGLVFDKIEIDLEIEVEKISELEKAEKVVQKTHQYCLISNSMRAEVQIRSQIKAKEN